MQIDRDEFLQEMQLRKIIRKGISVVQAKILKEKTDTILQEQKLRSVIKELIKEGTAVSDNDPAPHRSTGINVLEDLLKKIIPVLEIDFKKLTTNPDQRKSFRAHIIQAVADTLAPPKVTAAAGAEGADDSKLVRVDEQEGFNIDLGDDDEKYIPIDNEEAAEEPPDEREAFGIGGQDETGRNVAFDSFKKISSNIVDAYDILSSDEDKELFYDYLITNLKLYFDKFEGDIGNVEEPTTDEYEAEKEQGADTEEAPL